MSRRNDRIDPDSADFTGISLGLDGLTWWYVERGKGWFMDSGHVFGCGDFYRFRQAVRMYRRGTTGREELKGGGRGD